MRAIVQLITGCSLWAANHIARINEAAQLQTLWVSTGGTPIGTYRAHCIE